MEHQTLLIHRASNPSGQFAKNLERYRITITIALKVE